MSWERGLLEDTNCSLCNREIESILHALLDCEKIKLVWIQLGILRTHPLFWTRDLHEWLESNRKETDCLSPRNPPWSFVFLFAIWLIWKSWNNVVFKGRSQNPALAIEIKKQAVEFCHYASSPKSVNRLILRKVRWENPQVGWIKMNIDGSAIENLGIASCGGILRDEHGHWIKGFTKKIGINSFVAEH